MLPPWLHRYREFHADQLENHPETARYLIWSCDGGVCGGIGDRLRGIVTCFYLAVATERVFLIHNPSPVELSVVFDPSMIRWNETRTILPPGAGGGLQQIPNVVNVNVFDRPSPRLFSATSTAGGRRHVVVRTNMPQWADVLSHANFESSLRARGIPFGRDEWWAPTMPRGEMLFAWAWRMLFEPTAELEAAVSAKRARAGLGLVGGGGTTYVAVHIRRGGHWGDHVRHGADKLGAFANCTRGMISALSSSSSSTSSSPAENDSSSPTISVYVASDDVDSRAEFRKLVPGSLADDADTRPYHLDKERRRAAGSSSVADARQLNLDVWAEFVIISRADCVVYSRSGFSECPIALSRDVATGARCAARFDDCGRDTIERSMSTLSPIRSWSGHRVP